MNHPPVRYARVGQTAVWACRWHERRERTFPVVAASRSDSRKATLLSSSACEMASACTPNASPWVAMSPVVAGCFFRYCLLPPSAPRRDCQEPAIEELHAARLREKRLVVSCPAPKRLNLRRALTTGARAPPTHLHVTLSSRRFALTSSSPLGCVKAAWCLGRAAKVLCLQSRDGRLDRPEYRRLAG